MAEFSSDSFVVDEAAGTATITISRFGSPDNEISTFFNVSSSNGAKEGSDYSFSSKQVMFAAGDVSPKTITVNITNDQFDENDEVITMGLAQSGLRGVNGTITSSRANATLTIRDDDAFSSAQFAMDNYSTDEGAGTASVTVARFGTGANAITAVVNVTGGIATAGRDYVSSSARVTFPAGDTSPKSVTFNIIDDIAVEGSETITLSLLVTGDSGDIPAQEAGQSATITIADNNDAANANVRLTISSVAPKTLLLNFDAVPGATRYRLMKGIRGLPAQQVGEEIQGAANQVRAVLPLHLSEALRLDACDANQCQTSQALLVPGIRGTFAATGYLKATDTTANQRLGSTVAVSSDGNTVALAAPAANGDAGAVYVYRKTLGSDSVLASKPIKIAAPTASPIGFGTSIALNGTGTMLLIGAPADSNTALPPGGSNLYPPASLENQGAPGSGAAFLYQLPTVAFDSLPPQPALDYRYIKATVPVTGNAFGTAVALIPGLPSSSIGMVVGAPGDDGTAMDSGAIHIVTLNGSLLSMRTLKAAVLQGTNDVQPGAAFGAAVAVSDPSATNGQLLVVGAPTYRLSAARGGLASGAAYVFTLLSGSLSASSGTRLESPAPGTADQFGSALAVSMNASTIAIGAPGTDVPFNIGTGVPDPGTSAGAVFIFRASTVTSGFDQIPAFLTSQPAAAGTRYGTSIALSADGSVLAVGMPQDNEARFAVAAVPTERNNGALKSGAASVLRRTDPDWRRFMNPRSPTQPLTTYLKASNTDEGDLFGTAVALSGDAQTLVVGAPAERGNGTQFDVGSKPFDPDGESIIDAKQSDNSTTLAGAAYLY